MKKYLFLALVAFLAVTSASAQLRIKMGKNSPIEKLGRAEIAITNLYVDSVDENKLVEDAIRGMLEKLDPHSSYTTAKETKAMNNAIAIQISPNIPCPLFTAAACINLGFLISFIILNFLFLSLNSFYKS